MKDESKVTVIVTLYNKEDYIERCLKSIANQSYQNLDIIVVNDGSTDNSLFKAQEVAKLDNRFRVVNKENGGVASARNYGINLAYGKFIIFIDGDDYINSNYISNLVKYDTYDLVISGFYQLLNGQKIKECKPKESAISVNKFKEYIFNSKHYFYCVLVWNKLFNTNIIKSNNLYYENIFRGEDADFFFKYLIYCKKIKVIPNAEYCNVIIPNTLSRKKVDNLWQYNLKVVSSAQKYLHPNKKEYAFLLMRSVKVTLGANCENYVEFKTVFNEILKDSKFRKINLFDINEKKNVLIYIGMKLRLIKILQKLFQIRVREHN